MLIKKAWVNLVLTVVFLASQFIYSPQKISFASELTVSVPVFKAISISKSGLNFIWDRDFSSESDRVEALKMFFTALAVPQKDWWVNLGVFETEDTVLGSGLFETDLGLALIKADLMLKQEAMKLLSPDSKTGRKFWNIAEDVAAGLGMDVSELNIRPRFWMDAGDVVVKTNSASAYIESAPIKVNVEIEGSLPKRAKEMLETALIGSVIPELEFGVNNSKKFSVLRQAHSAFVLALWYKSRSSGNMPFSNFTDSYRVGTLKGNYKWRQRDGLYNFVRMYYGAHKGVDSSVVGGGYEGPKELKEEVLREDISVESMEKGDKAGAFVEPGYKIEFGTSGHRINRDEFTKEEVENMIRADAIAVARYYQAHKEEFLENGKEGIIIGMDPRENNEKYRDILVRELLRAGIKVVVFDRPVTTPFIAFSIYKLNNALAINLTASHNPANYTGFKVTPADGGAAGKKVTDEIQKYANIAMSVIENAKADSVTTQLEQEVGIKYCNDLGISNGRISAGITERDPFTYLVPSEKKDRFDVPLIDAFAEYEEQQLRRFFGKNYDKLVQNVKEKAQAKELVVMLTALYGAGGDVQEYVIKKLFGEDVVKKVFAKEPHSNFNGLVSSNPIAPIIWEAFYKSEGVKIRELTKQEKAELRDLFLAAEEVAFSNEKNLKDVLNKWSNKSRLSHINTEAGNFFLHIFNNAFQSMFFASSMERLKPKKFTKDFFNKIVKDVRVALTVWKKALRQNSPIPIGAKLSYTAFVAWAKRGYNLPKGAYVAAVDGDGDRFGIVDKTGDFITPNEMGAILYYFMAKNRASNLPVPMIVKTIATSDFPIEVAKLFGGKAFDVAVGFKYFRPYWNGNYGLGLESSGHGGLLNSKTWDDGILMNIMAILVAGNIDEPSLSDYKRKIEREIGKVFHFVELAVDVKENPRIKDNIEKMKEVFDKYSIKDVIKKDDFYANLNVPEFEVINKIAKKFGKGIGKIMTVGGIKVVFDDGSYFIVRLSGTEPVVRLYSETWAKDKKSAIESADKMVKIVKGELLSPGQKAGIPKNEKGGDATPERMSTFIVKNGDYPLIFDVNKPIPVKISPALAENITSIGKKLALEGEYDSAMDKKLVVKSALRDVVDLIGSHARVLLDKRVVDMFLNNKAYLGNDITQGMSLSILTFFLRGANISDKDGIVDALNFCATALINNKEFIPELENNSSVFEKVLDNAYQVGKELVIEKSSDKINSPHQEQKRGGVDFGRLLIRPYEI